MTVALSLQWNDAFVDIARLTVPVIQSYALRHGYSFYAHKTHQISPQIVWQRIVDVKELIDHHEAVVHIDADCLITNPDIRIEDIMEAESIGSDTPQLFMSSDCNGINDGFCIWTEAWAAQTVLNQLLASTPNYSSPQDALSKPSFAPDLKMKVMPQRLTNSYKMAEYGMEPSEEAEWQPSDFILHLPGVGNDRRVEILKQYLQKNEH